MLQMQPHFLKTWPSGPVFVNCIALALSNAQKGKMTKGFAFACINAYKAKEIISVKALLVKIKHEFSESVKTSPSRVQDKKRK